MQEHQSRGVSPLSDYYFYYDRSALMTLLCGYETPNVIQTESNRMRLEFQSDSSITDIGFVGHWKAGASHNIVFYNSNNYSVYF